MRSSRLVRTDAFSLFRPPALAAAALLALCLAAASPARAHAEDWSAFGDDYPSIAAVEAMVADGDGNVLYTRDADTPMAMASITKIMTAVVALESGVSLDTLWTITDSVTELDPASSVIGYTPGDQVTLLELIRGLLVHSGNDAAVSVAECIAGSEAAYVELMNAKAAELGLENTHFANSHGLDAEGHYSCASDLIALARYAMQIPLIASIVGSPSTEIDVLGVPTTFTSTDALLNVYPGMRGIKTGYTANAGRAFLGMATRGGQTIFVVVLGTDSDETRWADTCALLDWAFAHYPEEEVQTADGAALGYLPYADRFGWVVGTSTGVSATLRSSPFTDSSTTVSVDLLTDGLAATDEQVGQLNWEDDEGTVASRSVETDGTVTAASTFGPFVSDVFYGVDRF